MQKNRQIWSPVYILLAIVLCTITLVSCENNEDSIFLSENSEKAYVINKDDVRVIREEEVINSENVTPITRSRNKSAYVNVDIVDYAGQVSINGQRIPTVIIGNQRWTADYYNQEIEYPEDFDIWTTIERFRRDRLGVPYILHDQFKACIKETVHYYLYSLAMHLDSQLSVPNFVEADRLVSGYDTTSCWHIPSIDEEFELRDNLTRKEMIDYLYYIPTGHFYHDTRYYSAEKIGSDSVRTLTDIPMATYCHAHWVREYIPNPTGTGTGPWGTWYISLTDITDGLNTPCQHQELEPMLPIRLVQTVRKK
ncbi:MAG: hypothetical protein PUD36_07270 [Bacteroidales bacterium]|nr:hypothetical protein [Bacteroidales bacterium]